MTLRRLPAVLALLAAVALAGAGLARAADPPPPSPREQAEAISETIRCPTCQGLSIADSSSVLAAGSRRIVEEQLAQGRTPDEIRQYFVDRYGEQILLTPRRDGLGVLVWLVPAVAVVAAAAAAGAWLRRRSRVPAVAAPADGAAEALADFRAGRLDPDASPAGETLREALLVRLALGADDADLPPDPGAVEHADARVAAAVRRYRARSVAARGAAPARRLPRRGMAVATALVLVAGTGTALAVGVRERGAQDLPTGDLPGGVAGQAALDLSTLVEATRERPEDAAAWFALGEAYEGLQENTRALEAYDRALELGAGDDVALRRAGVLVRNGSPAEALPVLESLRTKQPADPDTVLLLGLAQRSTGSPEADATLRRFLELAPDSTAAVGVRELLGQ